MRRAVQVVLIAAAMFSLAGCGHFFIVPDSYKAVKKAALVQYAINPHLFLGTLNAADVKQREAAANIDALGKMLGGKGVTVVSLQELTGNSQYTADSQAELKGYYTAPGMRFITDAEGAEKATLTPDVAKKLCADLGVDAVAIAYESWGLQPYAMGFKSHARPTIVINMFDKTGARVWGDIATGISDEGMASPGGVVSSSVDEAVKTFTQGSSAAIQEMVSHINV